MTKEAGWNPNKHLRRDTPIDVELRRAQTYFILLFQQKAVLSHGLRCTERTNFPRFENRFFSVEIPLNSLEIRSDFDTVN